VESENPYVARVAVYGLAETDPAAAGHVLHPRLADGSLGVEASLYADDVISRMPDMEEWNASEARRDALLRVLQRSYAQPEQFAEVLGYIGESIGDRGLDPSAMLALLDAEEQRAGWGVEGRKRLMGVADRAAWLHHEDGMAARICARILNERRSAVEQYLAARVLGTRIIEMPEDVRRSLEGRLRVEQDARMRRLLDDALKPTEQKLERMDPIQRLQREKKTQSDG